ncbi:lytic polysaccharide monooxygenase [Streptomyces sp. t39]|uniref:lytic polysaccharide monooxygenase auxiliary activity family 9 protein n=1 Tax=Streptomyces sp. t39 TaxID=1828156 RepID=UPI0011CD9931|nr:lytic polysaccharide monooxygenase [Streptomyces sp. t39]TXS51214.1 LPXTG cell wall anchor domain-containing protein [Streptomyces sp. t39]
MTARRRTATIAALGLAPLALVSLAAVPASAHGSMTDPVSRISACFAEGPESPVSAACKALVAAGGTQPLYDWNEVNIANAAGNHRQLIPDGRLCSAGRDKYKGLDLPRADWPSSAMSAGNRTFTYKATAPHKGTFELYVTKEGYDPSKPLAWSDLEEKPFAKVTDPKLENGAYTFTGIVPNRSGRHLIYSIWQRSDSPEAFYTCSDVVFGQGGTGAAPTASAPSDEEIAEGADKSTVDHGGHGGDGHEGHGGAPAEAPADAAAAPETAGGANAPEAAEAASPSPAAPGTSDDGENLAETGGDGSTAYLAAGGAAALAIGAAALFGLGRRRPAAAGGRHGR